MNPALVADVGNSRVKFGRCIADRVADFAALPAEDPAEWRMQLDLWQLGGQACCAVGGVHPQRLICLVEWLRRRGNQVQLIYSHEQLPLPVAVESPERVGIDRLLNAVAANLRRRPGIPAIVIDAGSAVTVDYINATGTFCGGAIFPGLRLMARALGDYTAGLPVVDLPDAAPPTPGRSTRAAIVAGIFWAEVGGIEALIRQMEGSERPAAEIFLGGGDASLLGTALEREVTVWPQITLEGIRAAAAALP